MGDAKDLKKNKISIILYHPPSVYGSIEEQLFFIAQELDKTDNYEVNLICASMREQDKLARAVTKGRVIRYRYEEFKNGLQEVAYLYRCFRNINPDIVHINELAFNAMIAANIAGIKRKILTYHTPALDIKLSLKGRISRILAFKGNWDIVTTTPFLAEYMVNRRGITRNKIKIINYGMDKKRFVITTDKKAMRRSLNISEDAFVIINTARLCKQKAQHLILESVKLLPRDIKEKTIALIAGEGEERPFLERRIKELGLSGKVLLLGHRNDIPNLLNTADLFVLPSVYEGAPISLMESMAMGMPVIASDIDGIKDLVKDGVTGLLIPPGSAEKLAEAIGVLARDKDRMRKMGIAEKEKFNRCFTKERMIRDFDLFYQGKQ